MAIRKAILVIFAMMVFLPACAGLQTLGHALAEAMPSPVKAEAKAAAPVPASPATAKPPARQQAVDEEQDEEDEADADDAEDTEEEVEDVAPAQKPEPQRVIVPSTGVREGTPASSTGPATEIKEGTPAPPLAGQPTEIKEGAPMPLAGPGTRPDGMVKGGLTQPGAPRYVSLNFDNADLELVLRSIADITGINFIIGPGVKANVTMRTTTRVPATEVFSIMESVLGVNNLAAVKEGSYYKIVPITVAQQEPQDVQVGKEREEEQERYITQIVRLDYLSADEMTKILQPFLAKGAKMLVHKETNSLIIAGFSSTIKRFLETVKALDVPTKRDNIQRIFVYFVENVKAAEMANILNTLYGRRDLVRGGAPGARPGQPPTTPGVGAPPPVPPPGQPPPPPPPAAGQPPPTALPPGSEPAPGEVVGEVTFVSDEATNALIIKTSPRNYEIIETTIKRLDIVPKQVLIELMLARISLNDSFSFSLEEIIRSGQFLIAGAYGSGLLGTTIAGMVQNPVGKGDSGLTLAFVDKDKYRVVLNNLAIVGKAEVLANPHLLTANNKEANIQIGQEVPIPTGVQTLGTTSSSTSGTSSNLFSTFQRKDIGIILKIKPHVNEKRLVTLDIETENTNIASSATASEGGASFNKVTTKTAVVVEDSQSLLIGGIIRTDKTKGYTGMPFLSSIPLLGYLFRRTTESINRDELLILITPHVVGTPEEGKLMSEQFRGRVESLEKLMKPSPTTSPSGLAPKLLDEEKGDRR